jgi:toxin ParE1/3/4
MTLPVTLRPEAALDVLSAEEWYERQRSGLGQRFLDQVSQAFGRIADMPEMYAIVCKGVRSCRLRKFPYMVYYRVLADRVEVLAVIHGSRDPAVWKSRL